MNKKNKSSSKEKTIKSDETPLNDVDVKLATLRGLDLPGVNLVCTSIHYNASKRILFLEMLGGSIELPVDEVEEFSKFELKESDFYELEIAFAGKNLYLDSKDLDFSIVGLIQQSKSALGFIKDLSSLI